MSAVPFTRTLAYVLRDQLAGDPVRLLAGTVTATVSSKYVTVRIAGAVATSTLPKLASYQTPVVGDAVYVLATPVISLVLGTVK